MLLLKLQPLSQSVSQSVSQSTSIKKLSCFTGQPDCHFVLQKSLARATFSQVSCLKRHSLQHCSHHRRELSIERNLTLQSIGVAAYGGYTVTLAIDELAALAHYQKYIYSIVLRTYIYIVNSNNNNNNTIIIIIIS